MNPITKSIHVHEEDYLLTHLRIINSVLPKRLTESQLKVLSAFMVFEGELANDVFGTTARKIIKKKLGLSDASLSNYIRDFIKAGFVKEVDNKYEIRDLLKAADNNQLYQFKVYV